MLEPLERTLLKSGDEILDGDFIIDNYAFFPLLYENNPKFHKAKADGKIRVIDFRNIKNRDDLRRFKLVFKGSCSMNQPSGERKNEFESQFRGFYSVEELFSEQATGMTADPRGPYVEKFQGKLLLKYPSKNIPLKIYLQKQPENFQWISKNWLKFFPVPLQK